MTTIKVGTLLYDKKEAYPGIVRGISEEFGTYDVHWFKWGYDSPDGTLQEYIHFKYNPEFESKYVVTEDHPFFRRHGLPPEYVKPNDYEELKWLIRDSLVDAYHADHMGEVEALIKRLTDYVMEQIDNG